MNGLPQDIALLVFKYRWKSLSADENKQLESWLNENSDNREMFEYLVKDETNYHAWTELEKYNSKKAFRAFVYRTEGRHIWKLKWASIAAVLVIGLFVGGLYSYMKQDGIWNADRKSVFPNNGQNIVLTLENGESVIVGDIRTESVLKERNILIDSSCIIYTKQKETERVEYNSLEIPVGGEYGLTLSDGTHVYINSQSKFTYPVVFVGGERIVELDGEAYFDVKKDSLRPFLIKMDDVMIKVLGTSFNVKAYHDEKEVVATLVEGSVSVSVGKEEVLLLPGEQLCYKRDETIWTKHKVDVELYTSWKDGILIFERERLETILNILGRWYGVEIFYSNQLQKEQLYSGNLRRYRSIKDVLRLLEMTTDVRFEVNDKTVIVK